MVENRFESYRLYKWLSTEIRCNNYVIKALEWKYEWVYPVLVIGRGLKPRKAGSIPVGSIIMEVVNP